MRRGFWLVVGAGLGAWAVLKVQRATARVSPSGLADGAARRVRHLGNDLTAAVAEGRRAKRLTEAQLRQAAPARRAIDVPAHLAIDVPTRPGLGLADEVGRARR